MKIEGIRRKSKEFGEYFFEACRNEAVDVAKIVEYTALQEECVFNGAHKDKGCIFRNNGEI